MMLGHLGLTGDNTEPEAGIELVDNADEVVVSCFRCMHDQV